MPVHNGAAALHATLESLRARDESVTVFLVDDGSEPAIAPSDLPDTTKAFRVVLARHVVNLGQGAALETARQLALERAGDVDAFVTMDADGQHRIEDVFPLVAAVRAGADVAFGNRFLGGSNVPWPRRAILVAASLFERALTGLALADAHNGFRAFNRRALERVAIKQNRMAHATEIKQRLSRADLAIVEVAVSVRYSDATLAKGQSSLGSIAILRDLFQRYLFGER